MDSLQPAPIATVASQQQGIPVCQNCSTSTTPLWRRSDAGQILCNACGLFLKLHGRARPISLKTNIIKSRNRVKPANLNNATITTTSPSNPGGTSTDGVKKQSYPAAHPSFNVPSKLAPPGNHTPVGSEGDTNANIAPQHLFDSATGLINLSPTDPSSTITTTTTGTSTSTSTTLPHASNAIHGSGSGAADDPGDLFTAPPATIEELQSQNAHLRTRVSELEVINELFRGRVSELEVSEREARGEVERLVGELEALRKENRAGQAENDGDGEEDGKEGGVGRKRRRIDERGGKAEGRETSSNFMMP